LFEDKKNSSRIANNRHHTENKQLRILSVSMLDLVNLGQCCPTLSLYATFQRGDRPFKCGNSFFPEVVFDKKLTEFLFLSIFLHIVAKV
jgi:hypothetical protein